MDLIILECPTYEWAHEKHITLFSKPAWVGIFCYFQMKATFLNEQKWMKSTEHPIITTIIITNLLFFLMAYFLGLFLPSPDPFETTRECVVSDSFLYFPTHPHGVWQQEVLINIVKLKWNGI